MPNRKSVTSASTKQYDMWLVFEILHNCIAHSNYQLGGRIYLNEFEDRLKITNPGEFIPGDVKTVLHSGYNPPFYRNQLLAKSMVNLHMIDTATMGIRKIFKIQKEKYFPMPDYAQEPYQVSVTIHGKSLNDDYLHLLYDRPELNLYTVYLLDRIQKKLPISKEDLRSLHELELLGEDNWLNLDTFLVTPPDNLIAPPETPPDNLTALPETPQDKMESIVNYCIVPRSRNEIQNYVKMKDKKHFINEYLNPLIKSNRLAMTIPDKPTSRNQKYVMTDSIKTEL
jgi:hypothetical protein